ncbi:MAG: SDR family oxidoreductase [Clostridiales Family XIII bacterium]|jgi:NAD(P)-dependent dehydrogenase (short-subunit alcohol dehydrogenase family)|nr:SDR family oxidoreductase [Clostridiales Family XIII bacterium]
MKKQAKIIPEAVFEISPVLRTLYAHYEGRGFSFYIGEADPPPPDFAAESTYIMSLDSAADAPQSFKAWVSKNGHAPSLVYVKDVGMFGLGISQAGASDSEDTTLAASGDRLCLSGKHALDIGAPSVAGKVFLITGAAQGFGEGIARSVASMGAAVAIADLNGEGAAAVAKELTKQYGSETIGLSVNVADDASVKKMIDETVRYFGGLDVMISCAGILIAGDLDEMTKEKFELVTSVNYTGYFLCAKYASKVMKLQSSYDKARMYDIIEINSKSGLEGSKANFAYAGGKFGGIGLTQSFALELAPYGIKVNAICPGNLLDGPLWSNPERGLFRQYLDAGKVPGAKTTEDVRRYYESKVPLGRGCQIPDVARAVVYLVDQQYETGQALPVTGGQVMLG